MTRLGARQVFGSPYKRRGGLTECAIIFYKDKLTRQVRLPGIRTQCTYTRTQTKKTGTHIHTRTTRTHTRTYTHTTQSHTNAHTHTHNTVTHKRRVKPTQKKTSVVTLNATTQHTTTPWRIWPSTYRTEDAVAPHDPRYVYQSPEHTRHTSQKRQPTRDRRTSPGREFMTTTTTRPHSGSPRSRGICAASASSAWLR